MLLLEHTVTPFRRLRDMHLISSNGSLPLVERLQMLFILILLFLLLSLDFLLQPCHASTSHKMEKPAGCFEVEQGRGTTLPYAGCFTQHGFIEWVSVTDAVTWLLCRLCFPGALVEAHIAQPVFIDGRLGRDVPWALGLTLSELVERGCIPCCSFSYNDFILHSLQMCRSFFFLFFLTYFVFFPLSLRGNMNDSCHSRPLRSPHCFLSLKHAVQKAPAQQCLCVWDRMPFSEECLCFPKFTPGYGFV